MKAYQKQISQAKKFFSKDLLSWFADHRRVLPWRTKRTPYRVWVAEIMLQQTRVDQVRPYYQRFMKRFVSLESLAHSPLDDVLQHWAGLGYYARGRNLHKTARIIVEQHKGAFPECITAVNALPGIGRSTAGAILALSKDLHHPILDGNVRRVLCRFHGISGYPGEKKTQNLLWQAAEKHTPAKRVADYTQAIMDMGATVCTRSKPGCTTCPQQADCYAFKHHKVASLPQAKPRKNRPDKHCYMLALLDTNNNINLFKRPEKGIWGGLYSLPEFESKQACAEQLAHYDPCITNSFTAGEDIHHSFSHFNLHITPLVLTLPSAILSRLLTRSAQQCDLQNTGVMMSKNNLYDLSLKAEQMDIGVPAPILKILHSLSK